MSMPLADALAQVDLEAGRIYRCEVNGRKVEVRVLEDAAALIRPAPLAENDIMLDPWIELPLPPATFNGFATPGILPFDIPEIPTEEESA